MDKEKILKELYEKVNEWFAERPQRPIAQFMIETMWQYIEAAQQNVQPTVLCACGTDVATINDVCVKCGCANTHSG